MGDSDIQEINSILNSLEESPQEGVEKIKSLLPRLLNTRLSDKSWATVKPVDVKSTVEFLYFLSTKLPQVFTYEVSSVCSVLFKLIPLMSEPKFKDTHQNLQLTISSLLQLFYGYDINACKLFYEDSIVLLKDLLENLQNLYSKNENVSELFGDPSAECEEGSYVSAYCSLSRYNSFLKSDSAKKADGLDEFMEDTDSEERNNKNETLLLQQQSPANFDSVFIDVSNVWRCTSAQVCVTNILARAVRANSVIKEISNIWFLVHTQIQHGQSRLKHASLCLLNELLENCEAPKTSILDSLVSCVLGLLSSNLPQQYLSHFRNAEIDEALGVVIEKLYNIIPPATIFAFSSQLTSVLPSNLQFGSCNSLKTSLCKAFFITIKTCPTVAKSLSHLLNFFDNEVIQPQIVECFNFVLFNSEEAAGGTSRGEVHKGKRRRLNLEVELKNDGKLEDQLLQDVLDVIDRTKPSDLKESPQKMISGVITIDTALQICLANYYSCPSLELATTRLEEWIKALASEMQNATDTTYLRAAIILVRLIGKIVSSALPSFSEPMLPTFLSLLSIPWLRVPLFNPLHQDKMLLMRQLGPASTDTTSSSSSSSSPSVSPKDYVIACLEVLAWLPPSHFISERKQYFSFSLRNEVGGNKLLQDEDVRVQAICNLPLLLARIGHEHVADFIDKLKELMETEESQLVFEAVARFGGFIVCLSDPENPIWKESTELAPTNPDSAGRGVDTFMFFRSDIHSIEPAGFEVFDSTKLENKKCSVCDWHRFPHQNESQHKNTTHATIPFNTWKPFFDLSSSTYSPAVRSSFIFGSFLRILRHAAPYSQSDQEFFWSSYIPLASDKTYDVRVAMARAIATFAASDQRRAVCQELLLKLKPMVTDPLLDVEIHKTAIIMLGELGCVLEGDILLVVFVALLDGFAHADLRPFVHDQIRHFTKKIGTTPKDLMKRFASDIYHVLMLKLESSFSMVEEVCMMLNYPDTRSFFKEALPHALPILVFNNNERVLQEIGKRTKTDVGYLCINHATEILLHMLMKTEQEDLPNQIVHLCEITNCAHRNLIEAGLTNLLYQLVIKLGNPALHDQAMLALNSTYKMLKTEDAIASTDGFSDFVMDNFLRHISDVLGQKTGDTKHANTLEQKENVLRSLEAIVTILTSHHLNSVRPKVMAILKSVIQKYPLLHYQACSVWYTFVCKLEISHLGPILSQIFVDLLPCVGGKGSEKAVAVFEYLVVKHRNELKAFFKEIPFLPDQEGPLRDIASIVLAEQSTGVKAQINQILHSLQHESTDVRKMALTKLKEVLKLYRKDINTLILSDVVDPVIHRLVKALLLGSRDAHNSLKLPYAECIGELGAIDPGRLGVIDLRPDDTWVEKDETEMASELITGYLIKALNAAANATLQDRAGYAIQEVLKFVGCTNKVLTPNYKGKGKDFWNSFPVEKREIIKPYLTSRYMLHGPSSSSSNLNQTTTPATIYHSNMTYTKWISAWTSSLLPKAQGPKLNLFIACRGVVKDDTRTAHYLLPYLLLHVLLNGEAEDRAGLQAEMLAVLNDCVGVGQTSPVKASSSSESVQLSTQKVFHLIDWMNNWLESEIATDEKQAKVTASGRAPPKKRSNGYQNIENMLAEIPKILLARAAYKCKSYLLLHGRATIYKTYLRKEMEPDVKNAHAKKDTDSDKFRKELEAAKNAKAEILQRHLGFLQKIYSGLDEPDGLEGCSAVRVNTTLEERIIDHEHAGHWSEALASYDMALQAAPNNNSNTNNNNNNNNSAGNYNQPTLRLGILNCLRNLGHFDTMASLVQGALATPSNYNNHTLARITSCGIQAAWRLGNWSLLEEFTSRIPDNTSNHTHHLDFDSAVGKILLHVRACVNSSGTTTARDSLSHALSQCRVDLMASLGAASMESYQKSYPIIAKLHMLHELEQSSKLTNTVPPEFLGDWESRIKITQPSFRIAEPILSFRRLIFGMHNARDQVGHTWLQIGKAARISNQLQTAANAVMKASMAHTCDSLLSHLESAKLQSKLGNTHQALHELQDVLRRTKKIPEDANDKMLLAKVHILVGKWMKATGQIHHGEIIQHYEQSIKLCPSMEKGHFFLASYYDTFISTIPLQTVNVQGRNKQIIPRNHLKVYICYVRSAIRTFGNALKMGHNFLFQSLPRLLTIWFEFGTQFGQSNINYYTSEYDAVMASEGKKKKSLSDKLVKIYNIVKDLRESLPAYQWITCFPQLISRICHTTTEVWEILRTIIVKVLLEYPQQGLWAMIALSKSNQSKRQARAHEILQRTGENNLYMAKLQEEILVLVDKLVWLCNESIPKGGANLSLEKEYQKKFHRSFHAGKDKDKTQIIVPLGSSLTATLPASGRTEPGYQPFAHNVPTINSFRDNFDVLGSVQQPKKVTIIDSSGKDNIFLCKPKDDLRKDARMMEFNNLINKLLKKDPKSRRRNLKIRTYAVTPLNEECGLIEWVNNTTTFKSILTQLYKESGITPAKPGDGLFPGLKVLWQKKPSVETFTEKVLPSYPPKFHLWFVKVFHDPCSWFEARLAYCGTLAVMSMVGLVMGLGDRHGENILFEAKTGEAVHVDFNCLFWKGLTFEKPERVPFRLTHNLVDAMGLTGYEGSFKKVCEITLGLLRANRDTLISVLHTFIYDPLVEWNKHKSPPSGEIAHEEAVTIIKKIEKRLMGHPINQEDLGLPLSVEGQVYQQIQEATSAKNLSQMYIGWAPWL